MIPFKGRDECILAKITSPSFQCGSTGLFQIMNDCEFQLLNDGDIPYCPIARKIEIIHYNIIINDKRVLSRKTLSRIKNEKLLNYLQQYL